MALINGVYLIPALVFYNVQTRVSRDNSTVELCDLTDDSKVVVSLFLFISRIFIPLLIMVPFTILLVYSIVKSNSNMRTFYTAREQKIFKKDVRLSIMAIVLNFLIFFLICQ